MGSKLARYAAPVCALLATGLPGSSDAAAGSACAGHQLLPVPRAAASCKTLLPSVFAAPDGALTADVYAVDPSLHATPDMESRIAIKVQKGQIRGRQLRAAKDYSSPGGANGYYVVHAKWTPDSQFFVYSLSSSGGHSPWQSPMAVYSRASNAFIEFSKLIGGNPTLRPSFRLVGAHSVVATTWRDHNIEQSKEVTVNLKGAISSLAARP